MKLNLGCGINKIEGFVNVDIDSALNPDEVFDFTKRFPYPDNSVSEVVAYHVLEHIPRVFHSSVFSEIYRVLEPDGILTLSFPEFLTCVEYWKTNYKGMKDFWEATIHGRGLSPHDHHVCSLEREQVARQLVRSGFGIIYKGTEPFELQNSVVKAKKMGKFTYQQAMKETLYDTSRL